MEHEQSGLLIAALVAIVAVVGLVILFKGGAQGAAVCPPGQSLQLMDGIGDGQGYYGCAPKLGDVRYIPQSANQVTPDPLGSSFQTEWQRKDREAQIITRTWEY